VVGRRSGRQRGSAGLRQSFQRRDGQLLRGARLDDPAPPASRM